MKMNNLINMLMQTKNPQSFMQQILNNSQITQNPIGKNALDLYQKGDKDGLNNLIDNLCKEKNIKRNDIENQIKSMLGYK